MRDINKLVSQKAASVVVDGYKTRAMAVVVGGGGEVRLPTTPVDQFVKRSPSTSPLCIPCEM